jgi:hypothetical protein
VGLSRLTIAGAAKAGATTAAARARIEHFMMVGFVREGNAGARGESLDDTSSVILRPVFIRSRRRVRQQSNRTTFAHDAVQQQRPVLSPRGGRIVFT